LGKSSPISCNDQVVAPVLAHFDEQEQMHGKADDFGDLFPRIRADRLDVAPPLRARSCAALALDKDRLLDADELSLRSVQLSVSTVD